MIEGEITIEGLFNLTYMDLSQNRITSLKFYSSLKNLIFIKLSKNIFNKLDEITKLPNL